MTSRANSLRTVPILIAFFANLVAGPMVPVAQQALVRAAADGIDDYAQCQIGNPRPAGLNCAEKWTNGILNATHNEYAEDEVVPQRLLMDFGGPGAHSVTISYMTRKDSGTQNHAYDYLAAWDYTYVNADRCQQPTATDCIGGAASVFPIPSDPNPVSPGGPQPTSAHEALPATATHPAGTQRQFVMYGGTITGTSAISHSTDPAEAGSDYGNITVSFTVGAGGQVQLLFGGHLASGLGDRGWGANLGSASISGGPYHIRITGIDGESIGNRDNQIMSNAITPLLPTLIVSKTPDGGQVTAGEYASFTVTVTNNGPGSATNVDVDDTLPGGLAGNLVWAEFPDVPECTVASNVLHCDIASLADDASFSVTVRALTDADDCGVLNNTALADADNNPQVSDVGDITVLCGDIDVDKTPDGGQVTAGDTAAFTIVTTNAGNGTATGAALSDWLPAVDNGWTVDTEDWAGDCAITGAAGEAQLLECGPEDIPAAPADNTRSVTVATLTTAADCGLLDNPLASVTTSNDGSDDDSGSITVECPDIVVEKSGSGTVNATDLIYFEITVGNIGAGDASNFQFSDTLPGVVNGWSLAAGAPDFCGLVGDELTCSLALFGAGDSFVVRVETDSAAADCGELDNLASASASNEADDDLANNSDGHTIVVECPDLSALKAADDVVVSAGEQIAFTITIENADLVGTGTAYDVQLNDPLPAGSGLDWSEDPDSGDCEISGSVGAQVLVCSFGDLEPGESVSVHLVSDTSAADCATFQNVATVTSDNHATLGPSADTTVECPGLNILKRQVDANGDPTDEPIVAGETAYFEVIVWNAGPGTALNATFHDELPSDVEWSLELLDPDADDVCGVSSSAVPDQPEEWSADCSFGDLPPSSMEDGKHLIFAGATDGEDCGELDNDAFAQADNNDQVTASASITVRCPTLVIDKAASTEVVHFVFDADGNVLSVDPEQVTWTLTYTLTNGPVTNAVITDPLPEFLTFVSASDGGTFADGVITWSLGTLTSSGSVSFVTTVDPDAPEADPILNVATIDSTETAPDDGEDSIRVTSESELGGTPTPSVPNTAIVAGPTGQPISIPVELMVILFLGSLGSLALANVRAVRRRR